VWHTPCLFAWYWATWGTFLLEVTRRRWRKGEWRWTRLKSKLNVPQSANFNYKGFLNVLSLWLTLLIIESLWKKVNFFQIVSFIKCFFFEKIKTYLKISDNGWKLKSEKVRWSLRNWIRKKGWRWMNFEKLNPNKLDNGWTLGNRIINTKKTSSSVSTTY